MDRAMPQWCYDAELPQPAAVLPQNFADALPRSEHAPVDIFLPDVPTLNPKVDAIELLPAVVRVYPREQVRICIV